MTSTPDALTTTTSTDILPVVRASLDSDDVLFDTAAYSRHALLKEVRSACTLFESRWFGHGCAPHDELSVVARWKELIAQDDSLWPAWTPSSDTAYRLAFARWVLEQPDFRGVLEAHDIGLYWEVVEDLLREHHYYNELLRFGAYCIHFYVQRGRTQTTRPSPPVSATSPSRAWQWREYLASVQQEIERRGQP
jgi:hypothetical protein